MSDFGGEFPIHYSIDSWENRLRDEAPAEILGAISKAVEGSVQDGERSLIVEIGIGEQADETLYLLSMFGRKANLMAIDTNPNVIRSLIALRQRLDLSNDRLDVRYGNGWNVPGVLTNENLKATVVLAANSLGISTAKMSDGERYRLLRKFFFAQQSVLVDKGIVALTAGPTGLIIRHDTLENGRKVFRVRQGDWIEAEFSLAFTDGRFQSRFWQPWLESMLYIPDIEQDANLKPKVRQELSAFNFLQGPCIRLD